MGIRKIYKAVEKRLNNIPSALKLAKLVMSEKHAIRRKAPLYKDVHWSTEQEREMKAFWKKYYGKEITSRWHKLYESMNGVYQKDYFPEMLYTVELETALNPEEYCRFFTDKSMIEFIYGGVEGVRLPKTFLTSCNGTICGENRTLMSFEKACDYLANIGECVIKPTVESGSGYGVAVLRLKNGRDEKTGQSIEDILCEHGRDYIVQERLQSAPEFAAIYPNAINTVRLMTYIVDDEIHHMPLALRIGVGGHEVDNVHAGGLGIGIHEDGTLKKYAYQLGYGDTAILFEKHPDTGVVFDGYYIGDMKNLIEVAKRLHRRTPHVGIISWDLTLDQNRTPVMIEANCKDQGIWFPQIVNECGAFGEDTPYMLKQIYNRRKL